MEPGRIVFEHVSGPPFRMTIVLADEGGQTKITWRMLFESAAECDEGKEFAVETNEQNLDCLEGELAKTA